MSSYILTTRNITDEGTFGKERDVPHYLSVPENTLEPDESHILKDVKTWMNNIIQDLKQYTTNKYDNNSQIVFYVHGYNTDAQEALRIQRNIQKGLEKQTLFPVIVVGFDWPTANTVLGYLYDRSEAHCAAQDLVTSLIIPFTLYNQPECTTNVHVVAHSMGGYVTREAFRTTDKLRKSNIPDWKVNQLIFVSADISSSSFVEDHADMISVFNHCDRLTNYFNGYDEALAASNIKRLGLDPRVGRVGMPSELNTNIKAVDVDCSVHYKSKHDDVFRLSDIKYSHEWYFDDNLFYRDLAITLLGRVDRNLFPTRDKLDDSDFVLRVN